MRELSVAGQFRGGRLTAFGGVGGHESAVLMVVASEAGRGPLAVKQGGEAERAYHKITLKQARRGGGEDVS